MRAETRARLDAATADCRANSATVRQRDKLIGQALALSNERDQWLRRIHDAGLEGYIAGYADGRAAQAREGDRAWAATPARSVADVTPLAELEELRWGPGGRESFGDPRPGDYPGGER